jgi:hypothetical protein
MRMVLIVTPLERRGYSDSAALDALGRRERPAMIRRDRGYVVEAQIWLEHVEAVVVYDDLPLTDDMRWVITLALGAGVPVEYRRLPADRISVIDRQSIAAS